MLERSALGAALVGSESQLRSNLRFAAERRAIGEDTRLRRGVRTCIPRYDSARSVAVFHRASAAESARAGHELGMKYREVVGVLLAACWAATTGCGSDPAPVTGLLGGAGATTSAGGSGATAAIAGAMGISGSTAIAGTSGIPIAGGNSGTGGGVSVAGAGGATSVAPKGPSAGCMMPTPATDSETDFIQHNITVTEPLDPAAIAADPATAGGAYDWTHRNYYLRLPKNYDPTKPYILDIGGSGCGGDDTVGKEGGYPTLAAGETQAIQVALSYLATSKGGACFADDFVNPPDLEYFDAVLADLESKYCIDRSNIFVHGYSSGAWETYMLGCARAGIVRAIGTAQGGMRMHRPACTGPVAAIMVAGEPPNDNPIGPLSPDDPVAKQLDSLGSAPARDDILMRNGCTGTATKPFDPMYPECVQYTGCPSAYPVVWCAEAALGHNYPSGLANQGFWNYWTALPAVP
jgi:poly(3-hydroxybutyrate) depolymerase